MMNLWAKMDPIDRMMVEATISAHEKLYFAQKTWFPWVRKRLVWEANDILWHAYAALAECGVISDRKAEKEAKC